MQAWMWWFLAALGLVGVEILTVDLFFLMAAAGAVAAGAGAIAGISVVWQFVVFGATSILLIGVVRPIALRHVRVPAAKTGTELLVGAEAIVLEAVDGLDGRVKVGGEIWSARATDEAAILEPGTKVTVERVVGATVLVSPVRSA